ncbi:DUF417 family protein [Saccharicrinis fermentans]|uniref:Inner membrane protein YkgB n=1 Tax=Saccharicrinis fermentans DSM 9555 = JCM 21142 TaxID=869213 RepID=W7YLE2_9BACT|nr:DUF417 family protein [Saccharicrinis fermentans]GAF05386.1 inner membrane protein YkgB [Saccharicrinis fermentans DSM 9555 = JCM 21142]
MKNFISIQLKAVGIFLLRYGLGLVLIWLGYLKFKNAEAEYTHQLISGGYLSVVLQYLTPYVLNHIVAYFQMLVGLSILMKPIFRTLSFWGGLMAAIMFLFSISFLLTSSVVWETGYGFPELSKVGQTILKDVVLFGAAAWCVGDSM